MRFHGLLFSALLASTGAQSSDAKSVTASPAEAVNSASVVILDVRTPEEFSEGHVNGALNIDFLSDDFKKKVSRLDKSKTYKVYCRSGNRSGKAAKLMTRLGFKQVENVGSLEEAARDVHRAQTKN